MIRRSKSFEKPGVTSDEGKRLKRSGSLQDFEKMRRQAAERDAFLNKADEDIDALSQELEKKKAESRKEIEELTNVIDIAAIYDPQNIDRGRERDWKDFKDLEYLRIDKVERKANQDIEDAGETARNSIRDILTRRPEHHKMMQELNNTIEQQKRSIKEAYSQIYIAINAYKVKILPTHSQALKILNPEEPFQSLWGVLEENTGK